MAVKLLLITVAIFLINVKFSHCSDLQCSFMSHSDGYNCHMKSMFENDSEVSVIRGQHVDNKNDSSVAVLFIESSSLTEYLPQKVCKFFPNMIEYECFGRDVVEVTRANFDCGNLQLLMIHYAKFTTIPADVFYDVPEIKDIQICYTSLQSLPMKLFDNNQKLTNIDLRNNQLARIDASFPASVRVVNLLANICVDKNFTRVTSEIYEKCANQSAINVKDLQSSLNATNLAIDNVRQLIDTSNLTFSNEITKINQRIDNELLRKLNESQMKLANIENNLKQQQELNEHLQEDIRKINEKHVELKSDVSNIKSSQSIVNNNNNTVTSERQDSQELKREMSEFQADYEKRLQRSEVIQFVLVAISALMLLFLVVFAILSGKRKRYTNSLVLNEYTNEN
jgi:uncharacterized membrane protein